MQISSGTRLGQYEILDRIGSGGTADVYRARDTRLGREVAIKVLAHDFAWDADRHGRFKNEAQAISLLTHPNICTLYDIGCEGSIDYIVMELLQGPTLARQLSGGPLALKACIQIAVEIAEALDFAHGKGIIHRDVKPQNMILTEHGAKLLDFGLAKEIHLVGDKEMTASTFTTMGMVGTVNYMSPEQLRGLPLDARTDIWSLGVVLYEMIAGHRPFPGATYGDVISQVLSAEPIRLARLERRIPHRLHWILSKALAKSREERYHTVRDLLVDFKLLQRRIASSGSRAEKMTPADSVSLANVRRPRSGSVAVLPFLYTDGTSGPIGAGEYLADGITESIINSLSQIASIRVIARTSVFRYKGREFDLDLIARELNVRKVLIGRLFHRDDDLQVGVELIDVKDHHQIWGERYQRRMAHLALLPREIAAEVSMALSGRRRGPHLKDYTTNVHAYQEYLKGRFCWNKRTAPDLKQAIQHFQNAVAIDPQYALAYVGLANTFHVLWVYSSELSPKQLHSATKAAVSRALELDPDLGEAHATLAAVKADDELDFAAAEQEFRLAITLKPNYATAHQWLAEFLTYLGRFDDALKEIAIAEDLDPLSPVICTIAGDTLFRAGRYAEAIDRLQRALQVDRDFPLAHATLRDVYELSKMFQEAIAQGEIADRLAGLAAELSSQNAAALSDAHQRGGEKAYWHKRLEIIIDRVQRRQAPGYDSSPFRIAEIAIRAGEFDLAYEWLDKAREDGDVRIAYLMTSPTLSSMRSEPRTIALLHRMGLA